MKAITFRKAFRVNANTVKVLFYHNTLHQEFVVEWNNIHPGTGEVTDYDIQIDCLSRTDHLNTLIEDAIRNGATDDETGELYLELIETFSRQDAEDTE